MFGLGLSAAVADADGAGYLELQESMVAQQLRNEFASWCNGLAAEYLHRFPELAHAKQAVRADFTALAANTGTGSVTDEERALVEGFIINIDAAAERLTLKATWQRTFTLWEFRTPNWIKAWIAVALVCGVGVPVILVLST